jgi:hypothetical protein
MSPVIAPRKPTVIPGRPTVFPGQPVRRVTPTVPEPRRVNPNPLQPSKPRVNPEPKNLRLRLK